jgi:hypothetical protein
MLLKIRNKEREAEVKMAVAKLKRVPQDQTPLAQIK